VVVFYFISRAVLKTDPTDIESRWGSGAHPSFPALYLMPPTEASPIVSIFPPLGLKLLGPFGD